MAAGRAQSSRERIDTTPGAAGGARYVRRDSKGHFTSDQSDVGRSLSQDRRRDAEHSAPKGQKDRGD